MTACAEVAVTRAAASTAAASPLIPKRMAASYHGGARPLQRAPAMSAAAPPKPNPANERPSKLTPQEKDAGYNESHGYGPGHGGPSGPGDAPSKQPATVVPVDDPTEPDVP